MIQFILSKNPALLQQRARARIDLAKICEESAKDFNHKAHIRASAWEQLRKYLVEAEKDLNTALEYADSATEKEWLRRDLGFLQDMKAVSQKPDKDTKIHVSNFPANTSEEELRRLFSEYGEIERIGIRSNKQDTGRIKKFAVIEFKSKEGAMNVLKDKINIRLRQNRIDVRPYRPQYEKVVCSLWK